MEPVRLRPAPGSPFASGGSAGELAIADFNSDNKPDLAIITSGGLVTFVGNGLGGFSSPTTVLSSSTGGLLASDFNGDGKPDLATSSSDQLVTLAGNGNGSFGNPQFIPNEGGSRLGSLTVSDMDQDGQIVLSCR
jgi:hypothetical protein